MKALSFIKNVLIQYPFLKNKYFLVGVAFFIWIMFIDSDSILIQIKRTQERDKLQTTKEFLISDIEFLQSQLYFLKTDMNFVEKIGREKYRLKKDNEDLYIIDTTKTIQK